MDIKNQIKNCITYRDLYALENDFHNNGLYMTQTNNGTRVLCAIDDGSIKTENLFEDYIFIEGKLSDLIPERLIEMVLVFLEQNKSNNRLTVNKPNYYKNVSLYGNALTEKKKIEEQAIRFISTFIQD